MDKADNNEPHKRERENIIDIDAEDDCSSANDTQCAFFLGSLKPRGKSFVLEDNKNGIPLFIEYEVENDSEDEMETKRRRKMGSGANSEHGHRTIDLVQNQCGYDVLALSSRKSNVETVVPLDNMLVSQNFGKRITLGTRNQYEGDNKGGPSKKDTIDKVGKGKNVVKGDHGVEIEHVVQKNNGHFYQKHGQRNDRATKNQCERVDQARTCDKDKVVYQIKPSKVIKRVNVVKGDHEANKKVVVQKPSPRKQAQPDKKDGVLTPKKLRKVVVKEKNMLKGDVGTSKSVVVKIENDCRYQKPVSRNVGVIINQERVVKGKNVVKEEDESSKKAMADMGNEHLYQKKPCSSNDPLKRNNCARVDQSRPGKQDEVHGQRKLMKVVKEENV